MGSRGMDKQTQTLVLVAIIAVVGGAFLCGLMCLSAYGAH